MAVEIFVIVFGSAFRRSRIRVPAKQKRVFCPAFRILLDGPLAEEYTDHRGDPISAPLVHIITLDGDEAEPIIAAANGVDDIVRDEYYDATFNSDIADLSDDIMAMAAEA